MIDPLNERHTAPDGFLRPPIEPTQPAVIAPPIADVIATELARPLPPPHPYGAMDALRYATSTQDLQSVIMRRLGVSDSSAQAVQDAMREAIRHPIPTEDFLRQRFLR